MINTINSLCDEKDYTKLGDKLNELCGYKPTSDVGLMCNMYYLIVINNSITRRMIDEANVTPDFKGKYWFVFQNRSVSEFFTDKLMDEGFYILDDITDKDFEK